MQLLDLPGWVLMDTFEFLSYDDISKMRLVCRKFDKLCQEILNRGFSKAMNQHAICSKRIKALLPRRESERRNHCLARHADILTSIETRLSMLSMTYTKYIDASLCCFIPGKILDEIFHILRLVSKSNKTLRPHEVLQELRDISSMAIEHFDEKIASTLKRSMVGIGSKICSSVETSRTQYSSNIAQHYSNIDFEKPSGAYWSAPTGQRFNHLLNMGNTGLLDLLSNQPTIMRSLVEQIPITPKVHDQQFCAMASTSLSMHKKLELDYKKGLVKLHKLRKAMTHQSRRLQQAFSIIGEQTTQIIELKKRIEDMDAKNRETTNTLSKSLNTTEQEANSSLPKAASGTVGTTQLRTYSRGNRIALATARKRLHDFRKETAAAAALADEDQESKSTSPPSTLLHSGDSVAAAAKRPKT